MGKSFFAMLCPTDVEGKGFVFPVETNTDHVVLRSTQNQQQALTSFTVCLRYYTDLIRGYSFFSYASRTIDNEILFYRHKPDQFMLYMRTGTVTFNLPEKLSYRPSWEHVCVSWESATGLVELWLDGKRWPRKGIMKGQSISAEASIVLGQDQDNFGGGFDIKEAFVGEIKDVYMWARVLSPSEMSSILNDHVVPNPVINWRSLNYDISGSVVLKPTLESW